MVAEVLPDRGHLSITVRLNVLRPQGSSEYSVLATLKGDHAASRREEFLLAAFGDGAPNIIHVFHQQAAQDVHSLVEQQRMQWRAWTGNHDPGALAECEEPRHGFVNYCGCRHDYNILVAQDVFARRVRKVSRLRSALQDRKAANLCHSLESLKMPDNRYSLPPHLLVHQGENVLVLGFVE